MLARFASFFRTPRMPPAAFAKPRSEWPMAGGRFSRSSPGTASATPAPLPKQKRNGGSRTGKSFASAARRIFAARLSSLTRTSNIWPAPFTRMRRSGKRRSRRLAGRWINRFRPTGSSLRGHPLSTKIAAAAGRAVVRFVKAAGISDAHFELLEKASARPPDPKKQLHLTHQSLDRCNAPPPRTLRRSCSSATRAE